MSIKPNHKSDDVLIAGGLSPGRWQPSSAPSSGIQFPYLAKIIGERIPPEKLCHNTLSKVDLHLPNGMVVKGNFPMLNVMRDVR